MPAPAPAQAGKRLCGICSRPLAQYNKSDICQWHSAEDTKSFRDQQTEHMRRARQVQSFVKEFHGTSTAKEMFSEARAKGATKPSRLKQAEELLRYHEALGLLKVTSRIFRVSMFGILRLRLNTKLPATARSVLTYLLHKDLEMTRDDIAIFLGYKHPMNIEESIREMSTKFMEDEDIILVIDLIREEYHRVELAE